MWSVKPAGMSDSPALSLVKSKAENEKQCSFRDT